MICGYPACFATEYRLDDRWNGNVLGAAGACLDIIKTGSSNADDEGLELGVPDSPGADDDRGVWDGNQSFGYRVGVGDGAHERQACGILGTAGFASVTEVGLTFAMAYGDNSGALNAVTAPHPIKHEEFGTAGNASFQETFAVGNTGLRAVDGFPFAPARWTTSEAACNTALGAATVAVGQADCTNAPALRLGTSPAEYTQAVDWPFGKWGCVRAHVSGLGSSNVSLELWYGNGATERTVFQMSGFDGAAFVNQAYDSFVWNSYMNANSASGGYPGLDGRFRRWIDNFHVRQGMPVPCSQIGFGPPSQN